MFRSFVRTMVLEFGEEKVDAPVLCCANAKLQTVLAKPYCRNALDRLNIRGLSFTAYNAADLFGDDRLRFVPNVTDMLPRCPDDAAQLIH